MTKDQEHEFVLHDFSTDRSRGPKKLREAVAWAISEIGRMRRELAVVRPETNIKGDKSIGLPMTLPGEKGPDR